MHSHFVGQLVLGVIHCLLGVAVLACGIALGANDPTESCESCHTHPSLSQRSESIFGGNPYSSELVLHSCSSGTVEHCINEARGSRGAPTAIAIILALSIILLGSLLILFAVRASKAGIITLLVFDWIWVVIIGIAAFVYLGSASYNGRTCKGSLHDCHEWGLFRGEDSRCRLGDFDGKRCLRDEHGVAMCMTKAERAFWCQAESSSNATCAFLFLAAVAFIVGGFLKSFMLCCCRPPEWVTPTIAAPVITTVQQTQDVSGGSFVQGVVVQHNVQMQPVMQPYGQPPMMMQPHFGQPGVVAPTAMQAPWQQPAPVQMPVQAISQPQPTYSTPSCS